MVNWYSYYNNHADFYEDSTIVKSLSAVCNDFDEEICPSAHFSFCYCYAVL